VGDLGIFVVRLVDDRRWTVKDAHRLVAALGIAVGIVDLGVEKEIGLSADLVGCPVVDAQVAAAAPDIDPQS
jgi:hypothetical protein